MKNNDLLLWSKWQHSASKAQQESQKSDQRKARMNSFQLNTDHLMTKPDQIKQNKPTPLMKWTTESDQKGSVVTVTAVINVKQSNRRPMELSLSLSSSSSLGSLLGSTQNCSSAGGGCWGRGFWWDWWEIWGHGFCWFLQVLRFFFPLHVNASVQH